MRNEVDQLLEDLEYIRSNAGSVGPDHPKVKKWVAEVRGYLNREGDTGGLKKFEQMEFVKGSAEMWSQHTITQGNVRNYKADLDEVGAILEKMAGTSAESSTDQKIEELFFASTEESAQEETPVETQVETLVEKTLLEARDKGEEEINEEPLKSENTMDQKIEPNFEIVTKQHLSASAREKTVDRLMAELNAEMKSPEPDWEKIQGVMGDMMGLKKTGDLLERLKTNVNTPGVQWETVREIMAELWSIKKEIVIDLLPTLLKS